MPLQKLQMRPGVSRESTSLANEGGYYICDKVRFRSGQPENLKGWTTSGISASTFLGVCRNLIEWETLAEPVSFLLLGVGTNLKFYILSNQTFYDITPLALITDISPSTTIPSNPFLPMYTTLSAGISATDTNIPVTDSTTFEYAYPLVVTIGTEDIYVESPTGNVFSGCIRGYNNTVATPHSSTAVVSSSWVTVHSPANGSAAGNFVTFRNATAFGPYPADFLNRNFEIKAHSADYVVIDTGIQSTATTVGGGATVIGYYEIDVGSPIAAFGTGWGAGVWTSLVLSGANTTLTAAINATATTINVTSTTGFSPSGYFFIDAELIQYAGVTATSFTGCVRSTANATSHANGEPVTEAVYQVSSRPWNTPATTGVNTPLRLWSSDTFGQDLVMNVRDSAVYYWAKTPNMTASGATIGLPTTAPWYPNGRAIDMTSADFGADAWAPHVAARVICAEQRHIIVLGTNDWAVTSTAQDPMLVRWCEQEDPLVWEPTATNTAGFQRLSYGSKLITAEKTREEILIWSDSALYSMRYLGPPYTFGFNVISAEITLASPNAVTTANNITYWMGTDKFYAYSGRVDTLPCSLRQYIFDDINTEQSDQITSGSNERYNEVWWFYCSAGSSQNDRYVIYNYLEKIWYYGQLPRTAWFDSHIRTYPVAAYERSAAFKVTAVNSSTGAITGISLYQTGDYEVLPSNPSYAVGGSGSGASLFVTYVGRGAASAIISQAGQGYDVGDVLTVTGGVSSSNLLLHEYGTDDALDPNNPVPINSYIESADFDLDDGTNFSFIKRIIPDVDFIGSSAANPVVTMTVATRNYPGQGMEQSADAAVIATNSKVSLQVYNYTNEAWIRLRGRQVSFRIGSDQLGVKWQLGVPRLDLKPDGRR